MKKEQLGYLLLSIIGIISIITLIIIPPIEQDQCYHNFSDEIQLLTIENFWNVISNLPFLIVGLYGLFQLKKQKTLNVQLIIFFIGVSLVSIGSSYYHINPNDKTLIWDRLPMTIAFTALISIVISKYINQKKGKLLLLPLLAFGLISILYWVLTGDLRIYALVQFYPMLAIPIVLILFKSKETSTKEFWYLLAFYALAKLFESYDFEIHGTLSFISGHSLKHVIAAIGIFLFTVYGVKNQIQMSI